MGRCVGLRLTSQDAGDGSGDLGDESVAGGWFTQGCVLGVAADLDAGALLCTTGGPWTPCFPSGLRPGPEVGAALLPAVSCKGGARVRCNLGCDASRPLRHAPPSGEYRPFAAGYDPRVYPPL